MPLTNRFAILVDRFAPIRRLCLGMLSNVRAIVFDLDDTLCGYWDASKAAMRTAFAQHGPPGVDVEDMVKHWAKAFREFSPTLKKTGLYEVYLKQGEPTRTEQMRRTLAQMGIEDEDRAQALSEAYARERNANLKLFPDAIQVLDFCKGKYKLGLLTNGPADIQRQEVAATGIESYFDGIFIEGEMGRGKPLLEVFRHVEATLGSTPETTLMVGNSYAHDVRPALGAGWRAVWIRRPSDVPPSADGTAKPESKPEDGPEPTMTLGALAPLLEAIS